MNKIIGIFSTLMVALFLPSFTNNPFQWEVPLKYQQMKNPVPTSAESVKIGKDMYKRHCRSCHGITGKGEGPQAIKLNQYTGDFTTDAFKKETDGAIFYKMTVGHENMPSFRKKVPGNEDIIEGSFGKTGSVGDLINYIRTLAK